MKAYLLCLSLVVASALPAQTVLVNDTFPANTQNLPKSVNWYFGGSGSGTTFTVNSVYTPGTPGSIAVPITSTSAQYMWSYFAASGAPKTLNIGDTITLTATFTISGALAKDSAFRFGLLNSGAAGGQKTADLVPGNTDPLFANYTGYVALMNPAPAAAIPVKTTKRSAGSANTQLLLGGSGFSATGLTPSSAPTTSFTFGADTYQAIFSINYSAANTVVMTFTLNDVTTGNTAVFPAFASTDATSPVTAFDTIAIGENSNSMSSVTFSNVNVTYTSAAPAISTQPASQTVTAGSAATFTVVATGTPAPTYQWNKGGTAVSGATNATYSIAAAAASDAGDYTVTVTNSAGTVTSSVATLTVSAAATVPAITTQPANVTVTAGASATFTAAASGSPTPTYQWKKSGTAISGATAATYTIAATVAADAGTYAVTATNSAGSATSNNATLTVNAATSGNVAPTITTQPANVTVTAGASATFTAAAGGTPTPTYQWNKGGTAISGATNATYTIAATAAADAGSYTVTATNAAGSATSNAATLTVNAATSGNVAPAITTQPSAQNVKVGASATFSVVATGTPAPTYQWTKGGGAVVGATNATLTIASVQATDAGSYAVTVSNSVGAATSNSAALTIDTSLPVAARLMSVSGRAAVGGGNNALILGVTFGGAAKPVVLRLAGPALKNFGLSTAITAPRLQLIAGGTLQTTNTGWDGLAASSTSFAQVGAFPFTAGSKDAAIVTSLNAGSYVLVGTNVDGLTGVGLGEIYDMSSSTSAGDRITNVSVRAQVGSGDNILIVGFVVSGTQSMPVVIRGVGPGLNAYGLSGLADPKITVFGGTQVVASNSGWDGATPSAAAFTKVGAFALASGTKDAALSATLTPGVYTVQLTSVSGGTGAALIEIYDAQ
jgi:hypothetical protein